jgi:hypothetical protein
MADVEKIREHVEKHKDRERAMFTVAGVSALLDELDRLREALELISEGRGVCGTCGEFAEGPGAGVTMCDNGYCVWEPQDPQKIAARALSTQVEERE